jgi:D-alanyl-D-alanine carboxypeptidase/D-alanyl-D-alanine-endopeptidase (penicillin-binding protein 4)
VGHAAHARNRLVDAGVRDRRTLKKRAGPGAGQAHIKGGTLTGVQSIAGYVIDRSGRRWVVVMIANHPKANAAQPAMDALIGWVYER